MEFTQKEIQIAASKTANTPENPRSCGYIMKGKKRYLLFPHKNGNIYAVRERTQREINKFFNGMHMHEEEYEIIPNSQFISDCNGNIYADFIDKNGYEHEFMIADYYDYIDEIREQVEQEEDVDI